jgi:hypothetical protein
MNPSAVASLVWVGALIVFVIVVLVRRRTRRRGASFQAGVVGALYEWQNRDKQQALQIIVDEKRKRRPSEHRDGKPECDENDDDTD